MNDFYWLNEDSRLFLQRGYLPAGMTPEDRITDIGKAAQKILRKPGFAAKFSDYMAKGYYSLSSPIWANFGLERALPISCFGSHVEDKMEAILSATAEVGMMSKMGGGTSGYFGDLRPRGKVISTGGHSNGPVHFMELYEKTTEVVSQGNVRRGSFAAYLPIEHNDIAEFLRIRSEGNPIQNMSIGITVTDKWMEEMVGGDAEKRNLWAKVIQKRFETGYPYILFTDTVNNNAPDVYKEQGRRINASNLCSEIALSSNKEESFVCCLSSMNLLHYEDWKKTDAVEVLTYFLDAVMTEFIRKTKDIPYLLYARTFAKKQRALGIGVLGWHSYLQSKMIAFESMEAKLTNTAIHKFIRTRSRRASKEMAEEYGEPEMLKGKGRRNVTLMAIAPTTSSSFILGQVSPSIEPLNSNYFVKDLQKGKFTFKNPYLIEVLDNHGENNLVNWKSILIRGGSVQHLKFLTDHEKNVFKTFGEISQMEILIQAAGRQNFIDQSQSINLMIHPGVSPKDVNELLIFAWKNGVKTLYYHRGTSPAQELSRSLMTCASCEG